MAIKQLPGEYAPDGSLYITLTDGSGNLVSVSGTSSAASTTVNLTAGTDIAAGSGVSINSSGNVVQTWGPAPAVDDSVNLFTGMPLPNGGSIPFVTVLDLDDTHFVVFSSGNNFNGNSLVGPTGNLGAIACTRTGTTISAGAVNTNAALLQGAQFIALSGNSFVVGFMDADNSSNVTYVACTIDGSNNITVGSPASTDQAGQYFNNGVALSDTTFISNYAEDSTTQVVAGTVSGTTITLGTPVDMPAMPAGNVSFNLAAMSSTAFVEVYGDSTNNNYMTAVVGTVATRTITFGTPAPLSDWPLGGGQWPSVVKMDSTHFIAASEIPNSANGLNEAFAAAASISGTTITWGTPAIIASPAFWMGTTVVSASSEQAMPLVALSATEAVALPGGIAFAALSLSGTALTVTAGPTLPSKITGSALINLQEAAVNGQNSSLNQVAVVPFGVSNFLIVDLNGEIYEGSTSGLLSPSIQHVTTWLYNLCPQDAGHAIASFIDWAGNLTVRVISAEPLADIGPIGFVSSAVSESGTAAVQTSGVVPGLTDQAGNPLSIGETYYYNGDGSIVTANTGHKAGVALTSSSLLIAA